MNAVIGQTLAGLVATAARQGMADAQSADSSEGFAAIMDKTAESPDANGEGKSQSGAGQSTALSPVLPAAPMLLASQAEFGLRNATQRAPDPAGSGSQGRAAPASPSAISAPVILPGELEQARLSAEKSVFSHPAPLARTVAQGATGLPAKTREPAKTDGFESLASKLAWMDEDTAQKSDAGLIKTAPIARAAENDLPPQEVEEPVLQSHGGAETIEFKIDVSAIKTHLPPIVARSISEALTSPDTSGTRFVSEARSPVRDSGPHRVLKFHVEPDSLGSISVRMRVTPARVDIRIDAESSATTALLTDAQDQLIAAMSKQGISVGALEVAVNPASSPSDNGQQGLSSGGQSAGNWGEQGFANQSRFGESERRGRSPAKTYQPEKRAAGNLAVGVIL